MIGVSKNTTNEPPISPQIFTKAHSTLAPSVARGLMYICYMPFLFISVNSFEAFRPHVVLASWWLLS